MRKTICDICGKEMRNEMLGAPISSYKFCISTHGKAWDICFECREELNKWIKQRKAESEK